MADDEIRNSADGQDIRDIREAVKSRVEQEASEHAEEENERITPAFIRQCLKANELGDGLLYAAVQRDKFLYSNVTREWLKWNGHSWERDVMEAVLAGVEDLVDRLLVETGNLSRQIDQAIKEDDKNKRRRLETYREKIYKRISWLRTDRGRNICVKFSRTCKDPIAIRGDELDLNPWLLACKNGVIDLKTGKFRPGRQDDLISKASPVEWKGIDEPAEAWENWLHEIFDNDEDLVRFLQRIFGYAITGLNIEHIFLVLWGQGRNGKGTFVEILSDILGPLAGSIQSEMLLASRHPKSSAGPSPDIMGLKGLRLAFASETDEGQRFSVSKVKWLTGGDELIGRNPHDKYEIRFKPTHTLILLTNHKPHASADDFAFWERLYLVPFHLSFVDRDPVAPNERPAKKGLAEQLKAESSGILAWLVRGCLLYQKDGIQAPESVLNATAEYKRDEDTLADFLEECCVISDHAKAKASDLYDKFKVWFEENISKKGSFSQKKFGKMLGRRFEKKKSSGVFYYMGLGLKAQDTEIQGTIVPDRELD